MSSVSFSLFRLCGQSNVALCGTVTGHLLGYGLIEPSDIMGLLEGFSSLCDVFIANAMTSQNTRPRTQALGPGPDRRHQQTASLIIQMHSALHVYMPGLSLLTPVSPGPGPQLGYSSTCDASTASVLR
jgi:hypothetical protein